jgi:hypothetical protein
MKMKNRIFYSCVAIFGGVAMINLLAYITLPQTEVEDGYNNYYNITMSQNDAESVLQIVGAEGFDSAFRHYSSYRDINDTKFHELRKAYIAASNELIDYVAQAANTEVPDYIKGDDL